MESLVESDRTISIRKIAVLIRTRQKEDFEHDKRSLPKVLAGYSKRLGVGAGH
jgi:hypothetical protein